MAYRNDVEAAKERTTPRFALNRPWFEAYLREGDDPGEALVARIEALRSQQSTRIQNTKRTIAMYEYGVSAASMSEPSGAMPLREKELYFNYLRNNVDTRHAKVIKTKIEPMHMTSGGTHTARRIAEERTKATIAEMERNNWYELEQDMKLDGYVTDHGAGAIKVWICEGKPKIGPVHIEEILVDDAEGKYRMPRSIYHVPQIDRYVAAEEFGKDDDDLYGSADERMRGIENAPSSKEAKTDEHYLIDLYEGWHLPSSPTANDGRHTIAVDGVTLVDEPWTWPCFPFVFYIPRPRRRCFWGLSLTTDLAGPQRALEKATERLEMGAQKSGGVYVIAKRGSTNPEEWTNEQGVFIETDNVGDVQPFTPQLWNPQMMEWHATLTRLMSESQGTSQFASQSQVPAGLANASGKALQVFADEDSEHLLPDYRAGERAVVHLSKLLFYCWRDIVRDEKENDNDGYSVEYNQKGSLQKIRVKDLVDDLEPVISTFPVSALARTPSARFAQLMEWLNAGAITLEQFKRLNNLPDLEAENAIDTADNDALDWAIDQMVYYNKPQLPDAFYFQRGAVERARKWVNLLRTRGASEEQLAHVRDFIVALEQQTQPPPPMQAPADAIPGPGDMPPDGMPPGGGPPMGPDGRTPMDMPPLPPGALGPPGPPMAA